MNRHDWAWLLTKGCRPPGFYEKYKKKAPEVSEAVKSQETADTAQDSETEDITLNDSEDETNISKEESLKSNEKKMQLKQEEINHFRNTQNIHVYGTDIPPPIDSFKKFESEYEINPKILHNLMVTEKYVKPTPIQMQAWPLLMDRREVVVCAPTGSGKTASFLVPIVHQLKTPKNKGFRAVILAPTRELARQIVRECDRMTEGLGLRSSVINKITEKSNSKYFKKIDILVTTPNKFIYLLKADEEIQKMAENIEWLIVDESDKLFEDGNNGFRDQLATIFQACSGPKVVRAMFSATISYDVEEWCKLNLNNVAMLFIGMRNTCPDVEQSLSFCLTEQGKWWTLERMINTGYEIPCLIFVQTKERAEQLCMELLDLKRLGRITLPVSCIHSDMPQIKRDSIVKQFRERKIWILICTELMSRGIDFVGINLVINYDFPPSIASYIHRVGRTGRAGKKGKAITYWGMEDRPLLRSIAHIIKNSGGEVEDWLLNLKKTSQNDRKKYAQHLPDRGIIMIVKPPEGTKKKRKRNYEKEENSNDPKKLKKNIANLINKAQTKGKNLKKNKQKRVNNTENKVDYIKNKSKLKKKPNKNVDHISNSETRAFTMKKLINRKKKPVNDEESVSNMKKIKKKSIKINANNESGPASGDVSTTKMVRKGNENETSKKNKIKLKMKER